MNATMEENETVASAMMSLEEMNRSENYRLIPLIIYLVLLAISGTIGNALVCHVYRTRYKLSNSQVFILCLSAIDLFTCLVVIPFEIATVLNQYQFDLVWACKASRFLNTLPTLSSAFLLTAIAVDRYRKVCRPFGWQISSNVARGLCIGVVALGLAFSWPALLLYGKQTIYLEKYNLVAIECSTNDSMKDTIYPLINNAVYAILFLSGIICICVLYCFIGRKVKKHSKRFREYARISIPMLSTDGAIEGIARDSANVLTKCTKNIEQNHKIPKNCKCEETDGSWTENKPQEENSGEKNANQEVFDVQTEFKEKTFPKEEPISSDSGVKMEKHTNGSTSSLVSNNVSFVHDCQPSDVKAAENGELKNDNRNLSKKFSNSISTLRRGLSGIFNRMTSTSSRASSDSTALSKTQFLKQARARKTAFVMFLISLVFVLSYLPHLLLMLVRSLNSHFVESMSDAGRATYRFFLRSYFLNAAVNPIIYSACDSRFRSACKEYFQRLCRCRSEMTSEESKVV